jgi:hypothetical protein
VRCLFYLAVVIGRPSAHSARLLACLLSWLAGHGCLPWLIVRRGATKRQASPMAERCTWWSMQSSVLIPLASRGHMSASGSRGHTSIRARSASEEGVVAGKISCSPHPLRSTKQPSASWRNSILCARQPVVTSVPRRRSPERPITRRRAPPARDCAPCPLADPRPRNGTRIRQATCDA